ncbi:hypothetical protein AAHA92_30673 [Salvia divinorum]|uniref:Uncharacterized protein n=1 Tax=Salvia divinorum TaxID=28513 RepID=A0ABD1FSK5_SALDI
MSGKSKIGVLTRARKIYGKALCNCGGDGRGVVNCTVPQTDRKRSAGESKEIIGGEDIRDLMQLLSMGGRGGGATVDVDSEGNIVWRKAAAGSSYGGGVGRIGRIDEEKPCCFSEGDVFNKSRYSNTSISVNYKPRLLK